MSDKDWINYCVILVITGCITTFLIRFSELIIARCG